jgi:anti-sigma factor RsiW
MREQLGVYALGHGTPDERAAVTAHLDGCPSCRAELAELAPLRSRLTGVDADRLDEMPAPPPALGEAVLARIETEHRASGRRADARRRPLLVATAAAAAAAALGFGTGWLARPVPDPPLERVSVQLLDEDVQASADIIPHTWGVEVVLVGDGFTAGEVHRVLVTESDGDQVPAGQFIGVGPTELTCRLNSSVLRDDAVGFTVLDASGQVVLVSEF